jgi:protein phosphatase PTC2/3
MQPQVVLGPHRVFPGRLSVCRTIGDIEAKAPPLLGNPNVVIADPDISEFKIDGKRDDFIILGCDGIFDKLEDQDCVHIAWQACVNEKNSEQAQKLHAESS